MKINVELDSEEEFIQFSNLMQREKHNLASVLYGRYKTMYEETNEKLTFLQKKISEQNDDKTKYYAIEIDAWDSDFSFNVRAINCLKHANILTVGQLLECSEVDLRGMLNLGKGTIKHIREELAKCGLELKRG